MTRKEFDNAVAAAYEKLPDKIKSRMKNVAITIEETVDTETVHAMDLESHMDLLGLYRGVPQTDRDNSAGFSLPDTITLYMLPILEEADMSGKSPEKIIFETLWHEVAHHFGLGETDVEKREKEEFGED